MAELGQLSQPVVVQARPEVPVLSTQKLFLGKREIGIDHGGVRYRLRITRRNKLILQK